MNKLEQIHQLAKVLITAGLAEWDGDDAENKARLVIEELERRDIRLVSNEPGVLPFKPKPLLGGSVDAVSPNRSTQQLGKIEFPKQPESEVGRFEDGEDTP